MKDLVLRFLRWSRPFSDNVLAEGNSRLVFRPVRKLKLHDCSEIQSTATKLPLLYSNHPFTLNTHPKQTCSLNYLIASEAIICTFYFHLLICRFILERNVNLIYLSNQQFSPLLNIGFLYVFPSSPSWALAIQVAKILLRLSNQRVGGLSLLFVHPWTPIYCIFPWYFVVLHFLKLVIEFVCWNINNFLWSLVYDFCILSSGGFTNCWFL